MPKWRIQARWTRDSDRWGQLGTVWGVFWEVSQIYVSRRYFLEKGGQLSPTIPTLAPLAPEWHRVRNCKGSGHVAYGGNRS
jgi:hypothetical protein